MQQEPRPSRGENDEGTVPEEPPGTTPPGTWRQRAGFTVFVDVRSDDRQNEAWRTRIYHEETGDEILLVGTEAYGWLSWVLQRIQVSEREAEATGLEAGTSEPDTPAGSRHPGAHIVTVRIIGAEIERLDAAGTSGEHHIRIEAVLVVEGIADVERSLGAALMRAAFGEPTR